MQRVRRLVTRTFTPREFRIVAYVALGGLHDDRLHRRGRAADGLRARLPGLAALQRHELHARAAAPTR